MGFVALGLTIDIGGLTGRVWLEGIVLALALALIVRPLVVLLTLGPARLSWAERAVIDPVTSTTMTVAPFGR